MPQPRSSHLTIMAVAVAVMSASVANLLCRPPLAASFASLICKLVLSFVDNRPLPPPRSTTTVCYWPAASCAMVCAGLCHQPLQWSFAGLCHQSLYPAGLADDGLQPSFATGRPCPLSLLVVSRPLTLFWFVVVRYRPPVRRTSVQLSLSSRWLILV